MPTCAQVGVLGSLCMQVGAILATETVKLVTGIGEPLLGRVLVIDALRGRTDEVPLRPGVAHSSRPGRTSRRSRTSISRRRSRRSPSGATLLDVREPHETATGVIPGAVTIPLADVLADPAQAGPGPVVVVCAGRRPRAARGRGAAAGGDRGIRPHRRNGRLGCRVPPAGDA